MRLSERFVDNCILINSSSETKEAILNELVDTLCSAYKLESVADSPFRMQR